MLQSNEELNERSYELAEVLDQIHGLLSEAETIIEGTPEANRARSYWLAHIRMALDNNHGYLGGSMVTMQETINDLRVEK